MNRSWGALSAMAVLSLALAILVRWPVCVLGDAVPTDPNSGLHALAVDAVRQGSFTRVPMLGYPTGEPVRLVGLPTLLLGALVRGLLGCPAALEFGRVAWLALQGVGVGLVAQRLGAGRAGGLAAAALAILNPFVVLMSGNGQHENLAYAPMAALILIGTSTLVGRERAALAGAALATVGFCSPYQVVPALILALVAVWPRGRAAVAWTLGGAAVGALPVLGYYVGTLKVQSPWGRPSIAVQVPATLLELIWPRAAVLTGQLPQRAPLDRLQALTTPLPSLPPDAAWPWTEPASASYLGLGLLALGAWGLWHAPPALRRLGWAGGAVLLLALGSRLHLSAALPTSLPLPWGLAAAVPGLASLGASYRFLSGVELLLVLGAALAVARAPRLAWALPLLAADALLVSPGEWPAPAARPQVQHVAAGLPAGPIAVWGAPGVLSPQLVPLLASVLDRPVAMVPPRADGAAWSERQLAVGVRAALVVRSRDADDWPPIPRPKGPVPCDGRLCVALLRAAPIPARPATIRR